MNSHIFNEVEKRFEPKAKTCSFCKAGSQNLNMEDNCFYPVYNVQDRTNLIVFRNVKFSEVRIGIPRCESCRKVHSKAKTASYSALVLGTISLFILAIYCAITFDIGSIGLVLMLASIIGIVFFSFHAIGKAICRAADIKSEKNGALLEPLVQNFLVNGWSTHRPNA